MKAWGNELWDKVDKVDANFAEQLNKNERLNQFLREKAKIDAEYSKNLKRLAAKYEKNSNKKDFTTEVAFSALLRETVSISNQYEQISEEITKNCIQPFNQITVELGNSRKEYRTEYSKQLKILDEHGKEVDRSKDNWISKYKNSEKARQQYEKADQDDHVTKADVEKARYNKEQKKQLAEDAKNEYANKLVKCNEQQRDHHTKLVPKILNNYQTHFLKSSDEFSRTLKNYCMTGHTFFPLIIKCAQDFEADVDKINKEEDSEFIVDDLKTGYNPPDDIPFEDIEQEGYAKATGLGVGLGRSKIGGLFKKNKVIEREDMSHLPPEQRKRALRKIKKDLEKTIDKDRQEITALEKMLNLASNGKMGDTDNLKTNISQRQNSMRVNEEKLKSVNTWLGDSDSNVTSVVSNKNTSPTPVRTKENQRAYQAPKKIPDPPTPSGIYADPIKLKHERKDSFDEDYDGIMEAECLYDFTDDGDGCITIRPGMRLVVTEEDNGDGWTKVKIPGTQSDGFVPTSYIQLIR